jgi:membrane dipeptidase
MGSESLQGVSETDYAARTDAILRTTPLIDGHNDLPYLLRIELQNKLYNNSFDFRDGMSISPTCYETTYLYCFRTP